MPVFRPIDGPLQIHGIRLANMHLTSLPVFQVKPSDPNSPLRSLSPIPFQGGIRLQMEKSLAIKVSPVRYYMKLNDRNAQYSFGVFLLHCIALNAGKG